MRRIHHGLSTSDDVCDALLHLGRGPSKFELDISEASPFLQLRL